MLLSTNNIKSLSLEITSYCNIFCPQCGRIDFDGNLAEYIDLKHINVDTLIQNLELHKLKKLSFVKLEGDVGDSIMHPRLLELLDALYEAPSKPIILIITNGSIRNTTWWYELGRKYTGRLRVQFSIDGLEDTHHLYRVGSDYNKIINNARAFISGGGDAIQRCLIFDHNQHQIEQIKNKSLEIGFNALFLKFGDLSRFQEQEHWDVFYKGKKTHIIRPANKINNKITEELMHLIKEHSYDCTLKVYDADKDDEVDSCCWIFRMGHLTITYQGHLIPCCLYNSSLYFKHPSNEEFVNLVGDVDLIDINLRPLSSIINDPGVYINRFDEYTLNVHTMHQCETACGKRIADAKTKNLK